MRNLCICTYTAHTREQQSNSASGLKVLAHPTQQRALIMKLRTRATSTALITLGALALSACGEQTQTPTSSVTPVSETGLPALTDTLALEPRVVGGSKVTSNKFPWMAAIITRNTNALDGQFCGGSLIADKWILTAAHCIENEKADAVSVLLGQPGLEGSGGETINVARIIEHPDYQRQGYPDIALLELSSSSNANPILLPTRENPVAAANELATVIGWGQVSETGSYSSQLLETTLPIVAHQQCLTAYKGFENIIEDAMICAGTPSGDKDSCYGDSGGPLFVSSGQSYVQAGVVSFGKECGLANVPGVYARVSSYHDWISAYANVSTYQGPQISTEIDENPDTPTTQASVDISCEGLTCTMTANNYGSGDYYWDFGDGYVDEGREVKNTYDTDGAYEVYFGFVSENGDYQEQIKQIEVSSLDDNSSDAIEIEQFSGRLRGRGDYDYLPLDDSSIALPSGTLMAELTVPSTRRFALYLDRYDAETEQWSEVSRVISRDGQAILELAIEAGEYGFTVQSLSRGGRYTLDTSIE